MYRVAKSLRSGEYLDEIVSTELVSRKPGCALVIFQVNSPDLVNCPESMLVRDFIRIHNVNIDIGCSSDQVKKEDVVRVLERDSSTRMRDLQDVLHAIKERCKDIFYMGVGLILDVGEERVLYVIGTGGKVYPGSPEVVEKLKKMGAVSYIASGDSMRNLSNLAESIGVPLSRVFDVATPGKKEEIVKDLKKQYDRVVMVGDGINDLPAMRAADIGVLSIQQYGRCPPRLCEEADAVIKDIREVLGIIRLTQRSLEPKVSGKSPISRDKVGTSKKSKIF